MITITNKRGIRLRFKEGEEKIWKIWAREEWEKRWYSVELFRKENCRPMVENPCLRESY